MPSVEITNGKIIIDHQAVQIISGTIHYFRVHPDQWRDRILKAKAMGLNAIETYLCHNLHEPQEGQFNFCGGLDFVRFIQEIGEAGMYAIIRPGPYICAEWDNGGLPAWVNVLPGVKMRCANPVFLTVCERYLTAVLPKIKPLLHTAGGPVICMQLENEYGSFGTDKKYLACLREMYLRHGIDVPLFTSDGTDDFMLQGGTLPDCFQTVNFGSRAGEAFAKGRQYRPDGPDFCMEFWNGWFDHWGEDHHTRPVAEVTEELDFMLRSGASVNFFVFCGGTNFGFNNGANCDRADGSDYAPTVTSYDYDAPLSEAGEPTPKYYACQAVIKRYRRDMPSVTAQVVRKKAYGQVALTGSADLLEQLNYLAKPTRWTMPPAMEECGQNFGFIHYRTHLNGPVNETLYFPRVGDRVMAFVDNHYAGTVYRTDHDRRLAYQLNSKSGVLDLLVENMGRINYGQWLGRDLKGLPEGVCVNKHQIQCDFEVWNLELNDLSGIKYSKFVSPDNRPTFHRGEFWIDSAEDTFLKFPGVKGVVWVNQFNIGRYWNIGPGNTLYVPAPLLRCGKNEVVVLELHRLSQDCIEFCDCRS